jgi:pimeloyl-ACP methyl ester carboxylesterase
MRLFPARVTAAVLDGVVPFDLRAPLSYAASAQQSLDRVLADCRTDAACSRAHPAVATAFARLVARLAKGPVEATIRHANQSEARVRLSLGDFGYAVRGLLYGAAASRRLPDMIDRADQSGDLSEFAQRYWDRAAGFNDDAFADGLHFAVFCAEDVPFIRDEEVAAATRGTFLGTYLLEEYQTICKHWVRAPLSAAAREPLVSDIPTLLVSGWFDPVTPPETGERVANGLRRARHVIVRNAAHGAGTGCALPATLHVLREGTLDGIPDVCRDVKGLSW